MADDLDAELEAAIQKRASEVEASRKKATPRLTVPKTVPVPAGLDGNPPSIVPPAPELKGKPAKVLSAPAVVEQKAVPPVVVAPKPPAIELPPVKMNIDAPYDFTTLPVVDKKPAARLTKEQREQKETEAAEAVLPLSDTIVAASVPKAKFTEFVDTKARTQIARQLGLSKSSDAYEREWDRFLSLNPNFSGRENPTPEEWSAAGKITPVGLANIFTPGASGMRAPDTSIPKIPELKTGTPDELLAAAKQFGEALDKQLVSTRGSLGTQEDSLALRKAALSRMVQTAAGLNKRQDAIDYIQSINDEFPGTDITSDLLIATGIAKHGRKVAPSEYVAAAMQFPMQAINIATTGRTIADPLADNTRPNDYTVAAKNARKERIDAARMNMKFLEESPRVREITDDLNLGIGTLNTTNFTGGGMGGTSVAELPATRGPDAMAMAMSVLDEAAKVVPGGDSALYAMVNPYKEKGDWGRAASEIATKFLPAIQQRYPEWDIDTQGRLANKTAMQYFAALRNTGGWQSPIYVTRESLTSGNLELVLVPNPATDVEVIGLSGDNQIIVRQMSYGAAIANAVTATLESGVVGATRTVFDDMIPAIDTAADKYSKSLEAGTSVVDATAEFLRDIESQDTTGLLKRNTETALATQEDLVGYATAEAERKQLSMLPTSVLVGAALIASVVLPDLGEMTVGSLNSAVGNMSRQAILERTRPEWRERVDAVIDAGLSIPGFDRFSLGTAAGPLNTLDTGVDAAIRGADEWRAGNREAAIAEFETAEARSESILRNTAPIVERDTAAGGKEFIESGTGPLIMEAVDRMEGELSRRVIENQAGAKTTRDAMTAAALYDYGVADALNRLSQVIPTESRWSMDVNVSALVRRTSTQSLATRHGVALDLKKLIAAEQMKFDDAELARLSEKNILDGFTDIELREKLSGFDFEQLLVPGGKEKAGELMRAYLENQGYDFSKNPNAAGELVSSINSIIPRIEREKRINTLLKDKSALIDLAQRSVLLQREIRTTASAVVSHIARKTGGKLMTAEAAAVDTGQLGAAGDLSVAAATREAGVRARSGRGTLQGYSRVDYLKQKFGFIPDETKLSTNARKWLDEISRVSGLPRAEAIPNALVLDTAAAVWSNLTGRPLDEYWNARIESIQKIQGTGIVSGADKLTADAIAARGSIEFNPRTGAAIIEGYARSATDTFMHEIGHLIRTELSPAAMDRVCAILRDDYGISVTHDGFGNFVELPTARVVPDEADAPTVMDDRPTVVEPEVTISEDRPTEIVAEDTGVTGEIPAEVTEEPPPSPNDLARLIAMNYDTKRAYATLDNLVIPKGLTALSTETAKKVAAQQRAIDTARKAVTAARDAVAEFEPEIQNTPEFKKAQKNLDAAEKKLSELLDTVSPIIAAREAFTRAQIKWRIDRASAESAAGLYEAYRDGRKAIRSGKKLSEYRAAAIEAIDEAVTSKSVLSEAISDWVAATAAALDKTDPGIAKKMTLAEAARKAKMEAEAAEAGAKKKVAPKVVEEKKVTSEAEVKAPESEAKAPEKIAEVVKEEKVITPEVVPVEGPPVEAPVETKVDSDATITSDTSLDETKNNAEVAPKAAPVAEVKPEVVVKGENKAFEQRLIDSSTAAIMRKSPFAELPDKAEAAVRVRAIVELMRGGSLESMKDSVNYGAIADVLTTDGVTVDSVIDTLKDEINSIYGINISGFEHKTKGGKKLFQGENAEIADKRFFRSVLQDALTKLFTEAKSIKGLSLLNQLNRIPALKRNELKFTGLEQKLRSIGQKPITLKEAMDLAANSYEYSLRVQGGNTKSPIIHEARADYKYSDSPAVYRGYMLPGIDEVNLLLDLDNNPAKEGNAIPLPTDAQLAQAEAFANTPQGQAIMNTQDAAAMVPMHFGKENLAHARGNTQIVNGKKYFFLQEIQSDIMQAINSGRVKTPHRLSHPKTSDWTQAMIRAAVKYAVETGHEGIILPDASVIMPYNLNLPKDMVGDKNALTKNSKYTGAAAYYETIVAPIITNELGGKNKVTPVNLRKPTSRRLDKDSFVHNNIQLDTITISDGILRGAQGETQKTPPDMIRASLLAQRYYGVVYRFLHGTWPSALPEAQIVQLNKYKADLHKQYASNWHTHAQAMLESAKIVQQRAWNVLNMLEQNAREHPAVRAYANLSEKISLLEEKGHDVIFPGELTTMPLEERNSRIQQMAAKAAGENIDIMSEFDAFFTSAPSGKSLADIAEVQRDLIESVEQKKQLLRNEEKQIGLSGLDSYNFYYMVGKLNKLSLPDLDVSLPESELLRKDAEQTKNFIQTLNEARDVIAIVEQTVKNMGEASAPKIALQAIDFTPEIKSKYAKPQPLFQPEPDASKPGIRITIDDSKYSEEVRRAEEAWAEVIESTLKSENPLPENTHPVLRQVADIIKRQAIQTGTTLRDSGVRPAGGNKLMQGDEAPRMPRFKSVLVDAVNTAFANKTEIVAGSLLNQLRKAGVTGNEFRFTGIEKFLTEKGQKKVTAAELDGYLESSWDATVEKSRAWVQHMLPGEDAIELLVQIPGQKQGSDASKHYAGTPTAHVRGNAQVIDGKKYFFIQEIQSDAAQGLRETTEPELYNLAQPDTMSWTRTAVRTALQYASLNAYDGIILPQADIIMPYNLGLPEELVGSRKAFFDSPMVGEKAEKSFLGTEKYLNTAAIPVIKSELDKATPVQKSLKTLVGKTTDNINRAKEVLAANLKEITSAQTAIATSSGQIQPSLDLLTFTGPQLRMQVITDWWETNYKRLAQREQQAKNMMLRHTYNSVENLTNHFEDMLYNVEQKILSAQYTIATFTRRQERLVKYESPFTKEELKTVQNNILHTQETIARLQEEKNKFLLAQERLSEETKTEIMEEQLAAGNLEIFLAVDSQGHWFNDAQIVDSVKRDIAELQALLATQDTTRGIAVQTIDFTPEMRAKFSQPQKLYQEKKLTPEGTTARGSDALFQEFLNQFTEDTASATPFGKTQIKKIAPEQTILFDPQDLADPFQAHSRLAAELRSVKNEITDKGENDPELSRKKSELEAKIKALIQTTEYKTGLKYQLEKQLSEITKQYGDSIPKNVAKNIEKLRQKIAFLAKDIADAEVVAEQATVSNLTGQDALNITPKEIARTVPESDLTDSWYQKLTTSPKLRFLVGLVTGIGDDEKLRQRAIPKEARTIFMSAVRPIQETTADISRLITEGSENLAATKRTLIEAAVAGDEKAARVFSFLNGEQTNFGSGLPAVTSGVNHIEWATARIEAKWHSLEFEEQLLLQKLAEASGFDESGNVKSYASGLDPATANAASAVLARIRHEAGIAEKNADDSNPGDLFFGMAKQSVWPGSLADDVVKLNAWTLSLFNSAQLLGRAAIEPNPAMRLVSAMSYNVGANIEAAHHASVWLATHGALQQSRTALASQAFGINKKDAVMFDKWKTGQYLSEMDYTRVEEIARQYGLTPDFELAPELGYGDILLPRSLRVALHAELMHGRRMLDTESKLALQFGADPQAVLAGQYSVNPVAAHIQRMVMAIRKSEIFGNVLLKPRGFMTDVISMAEASASNAGFGVMARSTAQRSLQLMMTNTPFLSEIFDGMAMLSRVAGSDNRVAKLQSAIRRRLSDAGDAVARLGIKATSASRAIPVVTEVIDGAKDKFIKTPKGDISHFELRQIWLQEGVFNSFERGQTTEALFNEVAPKSGTTARKWVQQKLGAFQRYRYEQSAEHGIYARTGMAVTFLQMGYDPRTAARLSLATSFDYVNSTTGWDKSLAIGMFMPFQAFRKNNSRFVINRLTSYSSIRKMAMAHRLFRNIPDVFAAISAAEQREDGEEYGIRVSDLNHIGRDEFDRMRLILEEGYSALFGDNPSQWPDDLKRSIAGPDADFDAVWAGMSPEGQKLLISGYGGYENVPQEVKMYMNDFFAARVRTIGPAVPHGSPMMLDRKQVNPNESIYIQNSHIVAEPDFFADRDRYLYDYQTNRPGAVIPIPSDRQTMNYRNAAMQRKLRAPGGSGFDTSTGIVFTLPETSFGTACTHLGLAMGAAMTLYNTAARTGEAIFEPSDEDFANWKGATPMTADEYEPSRTSPYYSLEQAFKANQAILEQVNDPERAILAGDAIKAMSGENRSTRLAPFIGEFLLATPGNFGVEIDKTGVEPKYYLTPGGKLIMLTFTGTVLLEANATALRLSDTVDPLRETPKTQLGAAVQDTVAREDYMDPMLILQMLKSTGFAVSEQSPSAVMNSLSPEWTKTTSTPK